MFPLSAQQIAQQVQSQAWLNALPEAPIQALSKDTRSLKAGELYVALSGEQFDGHQFLAQAQAAGAVAALVERFDHQCSLAQIQVADTLLALGELAAANRAQFCGPVVAITGSAGKTSTKQLTQAVLSQQFVTHMTQGNLNNQIGAPLTLLELAQQHQAAVIELGASQVGDIAYTARWVKPQIAIITNAAEAHLEGFGNIEAVVRTKGELLDHLAQAASVILNADDPHCSDWQARAQHNGVANIVLFGFSAEAQVRAEKLHSNFSGSQFELIYGQQKGQVQLPLLGRHNVHNALAAAAAGFTLGLSLEQVIAGLQSVQNAAGRMQLLRGAQGQTLINDSYNASPISVMAAIDVLQEATQSWLVLGDMAELGEQAISAHQQVGRYAQERNIQHLLATGPLAQHAVASFGAQGQWFATKAELANYLQQQTAENDVILVKGSRSAGMETLIEYLQQPQKIKEH